ncbi:pulmonary surfactant-associated protein A-like [Branchiostoma lanceolatum]|uniref:pulmonary surfactant-associated protein A-like n=1 Tax=Branchiostoma lanceolatum TaxID=7740 RepID=UPI003456B96A
MWIGVDKLYTGVYKYSDGTPLKDCRFTNWAPNEPGDSDCVQFWAGKGYKWDDTYCTYQKMFICQIGPGDNAGCC